MLTVLEKVKLLLSIDIRAGAPADAMFVVLAGRIQMLREGSGGLALDVGPGEAIGAWALFDDQPRTLTAAALESCRLLRLDREEFFELLADHVGITQGIFKTLVRRIRALAESAA